MRHMRGIFIAVMVLGVVIVASGCKDCDPDRSVQVVFRVSDDSSSPSLIYDGEQLSDVIIKEILKDFGPRPITITLQATGEIENTTISIGPTVYTIRQDGDDWVCMHNGGENEVEIIRSDISQLDALQAFASQEIMNEINNFKETYRIFLDR